MIQATAYHEQDVKKVWSTEQYKQYLSASWFWFDLPFSDDIEAVRYGTVETLKKPVQNKSILELGSAMGQAYNFMKSSGLIDLKDYSGLEVSTRGHEMSKERFPEANWIHADFTKFDLTRDYDYMFERNTIHHMPDPIAQYRKIFPRVKTTVNLSFRGCIEEGTVSDLNQGRFSSGAGLFYLNIISVHDMLREALKAGFNHIRISFNGVHEPIPSDPNGNYYLAKEVAKQKTVGRFTARLSRCPNFKTPLVYCTAPGKLFGLKLRITQHKPYAHLKRVVKDVLTSFAK